MDHEPIPAALGERFTIEVAVDVVLQLGPAGEVCLVGTKGRDVVNRVADCVQPGFGFSVSGCGE